MVTKTHVVKKKWAQAVRRNGDYTVQQSVFHMYNIHFSVSSLCLLPCSPWVTPACDGQDSWDLYPLHTTVWKNSSVWPPSCKRPKEAAGGVGCFISGDSGKETPRMLLASSLPFRECCPWVRGWYTRPLGLGNPLAWFSWLCWVHRRGWNSALPPTLPLWCCSFSAAPCPLIIPFSCALYTFRAVEHLWLFLTVTVLPVVLAMW